MKTPTRIYSWTLLVGIALGFLISVYLGHQARVYSKPSNFKRFHPGISPETLYYPTFATLEQLALARWTPGKTIVIIAGNSILNGVAQPPDKLWSDRLQRTLGPDYVVTNLAFRGAFPTEGGALVAEALLKRGLPVILIANSSPGAGVGLPVGSFYEHFYWQALAQDALYPYQPRTAAIEAKTAKLPSAQQAKEQEGKIAGELEVALRFESLWQHVAYRHVFTVWTSIARNDAFAPRVKFDDPEPESPPLKHRFKSFFTEEMAIVRGTTEPLAFQSTDGQWHLKDETRDRLQQSIEEAIPPPLRPHLLLLINENAPFYKEKLSPLELARNNAIYPQAAEVFRAKGIDCIVVGSDFISADFHDRTHLAVQGGYKLADLVAEEIKHHFRTDP